MKIRVAGLQSEHKSGANQCQESRCHATGFRIQGSGFRNYRIDPIPAIILDPDPDPDLNPNPLPPGL
jgi:hypothetical protein